MIDKFINYIEVEKRYSENTLVSYKRDLLDFQLFLKDSESHTDFKKVDKKIIRNFIVVLSQKKITKRSINRKLSTLRSYYTFLLRIGEIENSPMESVDSLKFYVEKQSPLSLEEIDQLDHVISQEDILSKCVIEILYQTGMRRAELCNIKIDDVDFLQAQIKLKGKGNKERYVPISQQMVEMLREYLDLRMLKKTEFNTFFLNSKGKKLTEKFVYLLVNKYLSVVTTKKKRSPHILRHSFATHVLNNGAEISKVQAILGHTSLASTQVYTDANIEQLKRVFNLAHPRALKKE